MLGFVRNYEEFLFRGFIRVSKVIEAGIFFTETVDYFLECLIMVVIKILLISFTLLCHIYVEGFNHQM